MVVWVFLLYIVWISAVFQHYIALYIICVQQEEKQKRLGPGGLDPVEVFDSLPKVWFISKEHNKL